ncbi:MFS transporter [Streptomyces diastatochromogenes]|uniref:MFS transporter n=1 Tax=Streptomyces diastatochromogenes TaxID=42236 RepID=UPI00117DA4FC|nr:MFS transporter [Streptomyces diastatochromogenes]
MRRSNGAAEQAGGTWLTGVLVDRRLRPTLLASPALFVTVLLVLGIGSGAHAVLVCVVAVWGVAFGGAPTLIQTALVDVSGPADTDVATSLQTTVYNAGIAAGSLTGGVALDVLGAGALPWTALPAAVLALATVAAGYRHAFPAVRHGAAPDGNRVAVSPSVPVACSAGDRAARRSVPHGEGQ